MTMLEIDEVIEIHKMLIDVTGGSHGIRDIKIGYKELDFKTFIIGLRKILFLNFIFLYNLIFSEVKRKKIIHNCVLRNGEVGKKIGYNNTIR